MNSFITRTGSVSGLGRSPQELVISLKNKVHGLSRLNSLLGEDQPIQFVGQITNTPPLKVDCYRENFKKIKTELIHDLVLQIGSLEKIELIIFCNNSGPNPETYLTRTLDKSSAFLSDLHINNIDFLNELKLQQPQLHSIPTLQIVNTCASGTAALTMAHRMVQNHQLNNCLVISYELTNHLFYNYNHFLALSVLNTGINSWNELELSFSKKRKGFVKADSLAFAFVENDSSISQNKSVPLAQILAGAVTSDCHSISEGLESGAEVARMFKSMAIAAGLEQADIDYVSAHGSGTKANDKVEIEGMEAFFHRKANEKVPVVSMKSWVGHSLSSAALFEVDCLMKIFQHKVSVGNYFNNDPELAQNIYFPTKDEILPNINIAAKMSYGFGGYNAGLLLRNLNN